MGASETKPSASPEAQQILQGLSSRHIGERLAMEQHLQQMGPQAAELLLPLLVKEWDTKRKKKRLFWILLGSGLGAAAVSAIAILLSGHPELMGILGAFGGLGSLSALTVPTQRYYVIINALSQLDDVRAAGPLAEALSIPDMNARTAVARALMRLLPRLQPTDAEWLNTAQRAALHKVLKTSNPEKEAEFMLVIIQALTTIEDVSALPTLGSLVLKYERLPDVPEQTTLTFATNESRVQKAAQQAILVLQAARERLEKTQTLLRPSTLETAPDQLLRAAQGTAETSSQQLLRAGSAQEESR